MEIYESNIFISTCLHSQTISPMATIVEFVLMGTSINSVPRLGVAGYGLIVSACASTQWPLSAHPLCGSLAQMSFVDSRPSLRVLSLGCPLGHPPSGIVRSSCGFAPSYTSLNLNHVALAIICHPSASGSLSSNNTRCTRFSPFDVHWTSTHLWWDQSFLPDINCCAIRSLMPCLNSK